MTELVEVVITAPDPDWLKDFSRKLVEQRLCASAHNFAPVRSIYRWRGDIYERTEGRVSLHTRRDRVAEIVSLAKQEHPYEVPGISTRAITDGNPDYLAWITQETAPDAERLIEEATMSCDNFLYSFKGAPSARHAYGRDRPRELARTTGGEQGGRVTGDKRQGLPGVSPLQGGSFAAPFGRKPYGATSCPARLPRHRPQPVPAVTPPMPRHTSRAGPSARAKCANRRAKGSQPPGRNAAHCPGRPLQRKGTRRSFLTAPQKRSSGPTLERRRPLPTQRA